MTHQLTVGLVALNVLVRPVARHHDSSPIRSRERNVGTHALPRLVGALYHVAMGSCWSPPVATPESMVSKDTSNFAGVGPNPMDGR